MKKALILSIVFVLITFVKAWSQTEPPTATPTTKPAAPANNKTEQMKKAEEKSDGAAYSGKGKGGEKNMVDKSEKEKAKKDKKAKKAKKAKKMKKAKETDAPNTLTPDQPGDEPRPGANSRKTTKAKPGATDAKKATDAAPKSQGGSNK